MTNPNSPKAAASELTTTAIVTTVNKVAMIAMDMDMGMNMDMTIEMKVEVEVTTGIITIALVVAEKEMVTTSTVSNFRIGIRKVIIVI
jgi:hypothetical protein